MKEGILNVHLMQRPIRRICKKEKEVYGGEFDNKTEGLFIVNPRLLMITLSDKASLVSLPCSREPSAFLLAFKTHLEPRIL